MMNHIGTVDTEKKKKNDDPKHKYTWTNILITLPKNTWDIVLIFIFLCGFIGLIMSPIQWGFHYVKWELHGIEEYELYLFRAELLRDTDYIIPYEYHIIDENGVGRGTYPAYVFKSEYDAIQILFSTAWNVTWNPFTRCRVSYNGQYSFPDYISCGQWQEINAVDFNPITNNRKQRTNN